MTDLESIAEEYPFQQHYIQTDNGMKMQYVDEGSGPVVLLLHACPMWSFEYRNLIRTLSAEYRVIAPDLIGFGLSDKPNHYDYRLDTHAGSLESLVKHLGIKKMSMVMHGWGATIGCFFIIKHPGMIENVVLLNSMAFTGYRLPLRLWLHRLYMLPIEPLLKRVGIMFAGQSHLPAKIRKAYDLPYRTVQDRLAIFKFIMELPCHPEDASYEDIVELEHGLWQLKGHPVMILWAEKDWLYPVKYLQRWMELCPEATVRRLRKAGRYATEDAPEEINSSIHSFLKAHRS